MNILIIGNGFDLANNLPTRYADFLRMCEITRDARVAFADASVHYPFLEEHDRIEFISFCSSVSKKYYDEFADIAKKNLFIDHFLDRRDVIGDKWLNFEEEIELFIETLIAGMHSAKDEIVNNAGLASVDEYLNKRRLLTRITYKDLFLLIRKEHKDLSRLLDIYMDGYINKNGISKISGYRNGFYNYLLSFNYTSTFTQHYDPTIDHCYIHGEACYYEKNKSNIVLGFDDRYKKPSSTELESLPYEKFFQRLDLHTSNKYMEWLTVMECQKNNIVDIYGHSLAQADADILEKFIRLPNTKTRIYYYDDLDRYDKMRNLTMILGAEDTIQMVGGLFPNVNFIPLNEYSAYYIPNL